MSSSGSETISDRLAVPSLRGVLSRPDSVDYVCPCRPNRGSDLGHLDAVYDYDAIGAMRNNPSEPSHGGRSNLFSSRPRFQHAYHRTLVAVASREA